MFQQQTVTGQGILMERYQHPHDEVPTVREGPGAVSA